MTHLMNGGYFSPHNIWKLTFPQIKPLYTSRIEREGGGYTDEKENKIFLIYREIQMGLGAKSYLRKGFLYMRKCTNIFPIYEEPLVIYDFATAPLWISLYSIWGEFYLIFYHCRVLYCKFIGVQKLYMRKIVRLFVTNMHWPWLAKNVT